MVCSLPFQIGKNVSVENYNTFLDQSESSGYKFRWENGNVYIIEMANEQHEVVVSYLQYCFKNQIMVLHMARSKFWVNHVRDFHLVYFVFGL